MTSDRQRANEFMTTSRIYCVVLCPGFSRCSPPASAPSRQLGRGGRIAACAAIAFDFEPASRTSCPDLIRASTPFLAAPEDVDGRGKPGHDGIVRNAISLLRLREGGIPTFREPASRAASTRRGAYASVPRMDPLLVYVIMGGLGGRTGPVPTLWCALRGWDKDAQRAVFQSFNLVMHALTLSVYATSGLVTAEALGMFVVIAPAMVIPALIGARLYARVSDATFRRLILVLLLISGIVLLASSLPKLIG